MTDYYPLIARCLADLDKSTTDSRRELYWLARVELEVQLCRLDPPLTESQIGRERLALDAAIRTIEAERLPLVEAPPLDTPAQEVLWVGPQEPATDVSIPKIDVGRTKPPIGSPAMAMHAGKTTAGIVASPPCPDVAPPRRQQQLREAIPVEVTDAPMWVPITTFMGILIVVTLALALYWQRDLFTALFARSVATQTHPTIQSWSKLSYYVGQLGSVGSSPSGQARASKELAAAVPQKGVLYEEDPAGLQKERHVGSVVWRTETISARPGQVSELAIKADLEIPERRISLKLSICRNTDKALPASHTIEIMFNLPPDFPLGGIFNVRGILMKQEEQTRGTPLAGVTVKVMSGFFLFGLSLAESDMKRNMELLKERSWFDVPIVYNNGRRAVLAIEKGVVGERAFKEAFVAWGHLNHQ